MKTATMEWRQKGTSCTKRRKRLYIYRITLLVFVCRFDAQSEVENRTSSLLERVHKARKRISYKSP